MATTKKGKSKGKVMSLSEFQGTSVPGVPFVEKKVTSSWADVMDGSAEMAVPFMKNEAVVLPTAPKAARSSDIDTSRVPKVPPFKIYMGNIPYDIDEETLKEFFSPFEPIAVEIPKGDRGSRGFGYVEFGDRDSLIAGLAKDGVNLGQRSVRISLPDESGRGRDGERRDVRRDGGMGMGGERDPGRTDNDWRREPRELPPVKADPFSGRESASRGMGFDRTSGGGFERNRNGSFQPFQQSNQRMEARPEPDFDNVRRQDPNFGPSSNWERNQDTRQRFVPASSHDRPSHNDGYQNRYQPDHRQDQGYQQPQNYNDPSRAEYQRTSPREPLPREQERTQQDVSRDMPTERRKLQLQPRTKPKEEVAAPAEVIRSSIFGDAKPVDTTKKEFEIEEKLKVTVPATEPDLPSDDGARMRRTSTGSGKSGPRSRQTSESESHHSPRESAPAGPRIGFNRQDSDKSQSDRRPARILSNPDRDRNFGSHRDERRDNLDRRDHDRRDQYDRRNNPQQMRGGYSDRPQVNRREENTRYDNNGRAHYDGQNVRGGSGRGHYDDHNRNNDRRDRQPRQDRPRNEMKTDKEPVSIKLSYHVLTTTVAGIHNGQ